MPPSRSWPRRATKQGIEHVVYEATTIFAQKLRTLGIPVFVNSYGPGTHSWAYWRRDLTDVLPRVMHIFEHPSPPPGTISYTTADPAYEQWGWSVHVRTAAPEFSTLSGVADPRPS